MIKATTAIRTTTTAIRTTDFSETVTDPNRHTWTAGALRHVIAALDGAPVIIVTDDETGHALVNVTLVGLGTGWSTGYTVGIKSNYEDGTGSTIWHRLQGLGDTIIPLAQPHGRNAKWVATKSYMDESSFAVELAQAQHGKGEGREWGNWSASPGYEGVTVTYQPYPDSHADMAPRGERGMWTYSFRDCQAQGRIRQLRMHERYPASYPAPVNFAEVCENPWHATGGEFRAYSQCPECPTDVA